MCSNNRKKQLFFISNSNGVGTINNFTVLLNNPISTEQGSNGDNIKKYFNPINLSIDLSYLNITTNLKNNRLVISNPNGSLVGSPITVNIPDGNYSAVSLASAIQTALNNAAITWTGGSAIVWVITFVPNGTLNFGYTTAKPAGITNANAAIKIDFLSAGGFDSKKTVGSNSDFLSITYATGGGGAIISSATTDGVMDLVPINTLFIRSNIAKSFYKMRNNRMEYTDILFTVNIGSNIGGTQLVEFSDEDFYQEINPNFSELQFRITDKNDNLIDFLNGAEFNLCFGIETEIIKPTLENTNKNNIDNLRYNS